MPLAVYLVTLSPAVMDGDAAGLARQAYTLGLAYAPGYPVNALLGKAATSLVAVGPLAWRANLVGALSAAASLALGYALLRRWAVPAVPAVVGMWVLGFSALFWSQSVYINAYMQAVAFALAVLLALEAWRERGGLGLLAVASGLFGLGLATHPSFAVYAPVVAVYVVVVLWGRGWRRLAAGLAVAGGAGLAGCLPWLGYTVYYMLQEPGAEVDGSFVRRLAEQLTAAKGRSDWGMYVTLAFWKEHAARMAVHASRTVSQFFFVGPVLALAGAVALWRRRRASLLLAGLAYLAQMAFATTLWNWHHFDVYRLSCHALLALFMGAGLGAVWAGARTRGRAVAWCGLLALLTVGPPYAILAAWPPAEHPPRDRVRFVRPQSPWRREWAVEGEADARAVLELAPRGSAVMATWGPFATLRFLRDVAGVGEGVELAEAHTGREVYEQAVAEHGDAPAVYFYARHGQRTSGGELAGWLEERAAPEPAFSGARHDLYVLGAGAGGRQTAARDGPAAAPAGGSSDE
ncbi:MAG: protein O-mannosyl-transferase family [Candidatus Brocadiia bacterium]